MKYLGSIFFILVILFSSAFTGLSQENQSDISVITVSGTIDSATATFIERAVKESVKKKSKLIIFEMDTFGGELNAAYKIVDTIISIPDEIKNVAFVKTKAISAGALIALAAKGIYMKESTTIGDCAPISYYNNEVKMLGEKFQSPLRAKFRTLAKRNGYNESLAESMVSQDIEVYKIRYLDGKTDFMDQKKYSGLDKKELERIESKTTVVKKGELLTMDNAEALELGFSKATVNSINDVIKGMGFEKSDYKVVNPNWSEAFVDYILPFTPILMIIGLIALFAEFKMPGFGFPGITAAICLTLALGSQYIAGLANYTEILILGAGFLLIALEIFVIPGFGVAGISGIFLIIAGLVLSMQDFTIPKYPWEKELLFKNISIILSSFIIAFMGSMALLRYIFPKLSKGKEGGPYLTKTLESSKATSFEAMLVKEGDEGVTGSFLRPSGKIHVNGEVIDAISEGEYIEQGIEVKVLKVSGNRVVVKRKGE